MKSITPRLSGDEAMRQHMRSMRKAMHSMEKGAIEAKIAEHEQAIHRAKVMLQGMQEQANTIQTDLVRRQGAIIALRELIGQAPPQPKPVEEPKPIQLMDEAPDLDAPDQRLILPNGA